MPFHQNVNNEARISKMLDELGITIHPKKPEEIKKETPNSDQEKNNKNED